MVPRASSDPYLALTHTVIGHQQRQQYRVLSPLTCKSEIQLPVGWFEYRKASHVTWCKMLEFSTRFKWSKNRFAVFHSKFLENFVQVELVWFIVNVLDSLFRFISPRSVISNVSHNSAFSAFSNGGLCETGMMSGRHTHVRFYINAPISFALVIANRFHILVKSSVPTTSWLFTSIDAALFHLANMV